MPRIIVALLLACLVPAPAQAAPSLERMIGQMIVVGFDGSRPLSLNVLRTRREIAQGRIGGVMLLGRNVSDETGTRSLIAALKGAAREQPLIVAVDQEGGRVARLKGHMGVTRLPSAARVAAGHDPNGAARLYEKSGRDLARWGFNLNFGPVVDVNTNPANPIIGRLGRAFSDRPEHVARYARAFVRGHRRAGVHSANSPAPKPAVAYPSRLNCAV